MDTDKHELDKNTGAFFALVRAGLWEKEVRLLPFGELDFAEIYRLAEEQSVVGLVAAGLNRVKDIRVPRQELLRFIGTTLQMEERNKAMNHLVGSLVDKMKGNGIATLLVRGQGVAQCYERPLWRTSGDVDFYLDGSDFRKARSFYRPMVSSLRPDNEHAQHINMHYGAWIIELHENQHSGLSNRVDRVLDEVHRELFSGGKVRRCEIGGAQVLLPSVDNDVIIIFTHFLKHFYKGGVGLRQICDWCRLLFVHRGAVDRGLLEMRLRKMGLLGEWKAFATYAIQFLDMPREAMPLYDDSKRWTRKSKGIQSFVLEVGNLGHNRDSSYFAKYPYVIRKACSMMRRIGDLLNHARVFPWGSLRFFPKLMLEGFKAAARGD